MSPSPISPEGVELVGTLERAGATVVERRVDYAKLKYGKIFVTIGRDRPWDQNKIVLISFGYGTSFVPLAWQIVLGYEPTLTEVLTDQAVWIADHLEELSNIVETREDLHDRLRKANGHLNDLWIAQMEKRNGNCSD